MTQSDSYFDVVGIGFGPANIALSIVAEETADATDMIFLEGGEVPQWQPGMLISDSDIQNNPVRDLVSLRNPRSRYSFINYLHEVGRLHDYLNLPLEFPLRKDFAQYVKWAGEQVHAKVHFGSTAQSVQRRGDKFSVRDARGQSYDTRSVVVGTGRSLKIPEEFEPLLGNDVFHSTSYLQHIDKIMAFSPSPHILLVGASQSAVELALDIRGRNPHARVTLVSRGIGPRLKDTSPFTEYAYFPEFTDYYYALEPQQKRRLDLELRNSNYSAADADVIERLSVAMYEDRLDGEQRTTLRKFSAVDSAAKEESRIRVRFREVHTGQSESALFDAVILATGFRDLGPSDHQERVPAVLNPVAEDLEYDEDGRLRVSRDYQLSWKNGSPAGIFLNGLCESSHGLGDAGSFSLLSLRSERVLRGLQNHLSDSTPLHPQTLVGQAS